MIKNILNKGLIIIEEIMPIGVNVPNKKNVIGIVNTWAEVDVASKLESTGGIAFTKYLFKESEKIKIPAKAL